MTERPTSARTRVRFWPILKWLLFIAVVYFVMHRAVQIWSFSPPEAIQIHFGWLILAGLAYLAGWLPSALFWRALLKSMQQPLGTWDALRAYYVGHAGKYVPGKAMVLVIRGSLVKDAGVNPLLAGLTAAYETLVFMATGIMLALALIPFAMGDTLRQRMPATANWIWNHPYIFSLSVVGLTFASTPFSAWLFTKLGRKTLPKHESERRVSPSISAALVSLGVVVSSLSWSLHTISLGCVIRSISESPFDISEFPRWMICCTASNVGGFLILIAPGGLGVREGILIETLKNQPRITPAGAVVVAGLLRAVWFITEMLTALLFYAARPYRAVVEQKNG